MPPGFRSLPSCLLSAAAGLALASYAQADVRLPAHFSNHMVLQRDAQIPVWGFADAGEEVTVSLAGQQQKRVAGADGEWRVTFMPLKPGAPLELVVSGKNTLRVNDILVGEVWLASGQSNMDFTVAKTEKYYYAGTANEAEEVAAANHPQLRMFTADWTMRDQPQDDVAGQWKVCTPENVREFSAVAYFFARALQETLKVPVGIITSTYGASTAQAWTSREALQAQPDLKPLLEKFDAAREAFAADANAKTAFERATQRWEEAAAKAKAEGKKALRKPKNPDPVQDQHNPTVLFNGMIAPVIPYAIRGAIWYQGESNTADTKVYPLMQKTLIEDWRQRWGIGDFPFYFVQLANHHAPKPEPGASRLASFRESQAAALSLPNTGMVVTIDIGEEKDVHPRNKQDVGKRLARVALARTYGKEIEYSGPVYDSMQVEGNAIRLRFKHSDGLTAKNGEPLKQFAIAGADGKFVWADAKIEDGTVVVSSPQISAPAAVSYAWADNPEGCNLYNGAGLPAQPFRTER